MLSTPTHLYLVLIYPSDILQRSLSGDTFFAPQIHQVILYGCSGIFLSGLNQGAILYLYVCIDECLPLASLFFLITVTLGPSICRTTINKYLTFKCLHHARHYCKPQIKSLDSRRAYQEWPSDQEFQPEGILSYSVAFSHYSPVITEVP